MFNKKREDRYRLRTIIFPGLVGEEEMVIRGRVGGNLLGYMRVWRAISGRELLKAVSTRLDSLLHNLIYITLN